MPPLLVWEVEEAVEVTSPVGWREPCRMVTCINLPTMDLVEPSIMVAQVSCVMVSNADLKHFIQSMFNLMHCLICEE